MVRLPVALVLQRVFAWLVGSNEDAQDLEIPGPSPSAAGAPSASGRPRFRWGDRLFLATASRHLARETWRAFLVTPQTVLRWQRELVRRKSVPAADWADRPSTGRLGP
jgi:hypothetical protein